MFLIQFPLSLCYTQLDYWTCFWTTHNEDLTVVYEHFKDMRSFSRQAFFFQSKSTANFVLTSVKDLTTKCLWDSSPLLSLSLPLCRWWRWHTMTTSRYTLSHLLLLNRWIVVVSLFWHKILPCPLPHLSMKQTFLNTRVSTSEIVAAATPDNAYHRRDTTCKAGHNQGTAIVLQKT